ncbi:hypothetical protein BC938DRAFT_483120 [Jimgerdemannia flammicorona]|uniref:RING-type domain-containing protein n=1 Tax=Jimgerdemannia flammicorona TaxID=994334 RepID=A0A433QCR8_9FUNG|nr:hypothetical protein BC938DRAFT_483120 [Jimgerdemannia flammicorona]
MHAPTRSEPGLDSGYIPKAPSNLSPSPQHCMPTGFEPRPNSGYSPTKAFKADPRFGSNLHTPVASTAWPPREPNLAPRSESNPLPTFCSSAQPRMTSRPELTRHTLHLRCGLLVYPILHGGLPAARLRASATPHDAGQHPQGRIAVPRSRPHRGGGAASQRGTVQQSPARGCRAAVPAHGARARCPRPRSAGKAIVTKPPESVMVASRSEMPIVLFDSHLRPEFHPDSPAFLCFEEQRGLVEYLHRLMPGPQEIDLEDLDAYTAMIMGSVSVLVFKASKQDMDTMLNESNLLGLEMQYKNFQLQQENLSLTKQCERMVREHQREIDNLRTEIIWPYERELSHLKQEVQTVRAELEGMTIQQRQQQSGQRGALGRLQTSNYWNFEIMDRMAQYVTPSPRQPKSYTASGPSGEQWQTDNALGPRDKGKRPDRTKSFDSDRRIRDRGVPPQGRPLTRRIFPPENPQERSRAGARTSSGGKVTYNGDADIARRLQEEFAIEESRLMAERTRAEGDHKLALEPQAEEKPHIHEGDADIACRLQEEFEIEELLLIADRTHAESFRQSILECPICSSEYPVDNTFHIDECGHDNCRTCAAQYIQTTMETRVFPCLCPCCRAAGDVARPPSVISQNMVLSALDEEGQRGWLEMERERAITSDPTIRYTRCRNSECGKLVVVGTAAEASYLTSVVCPYCSHRWYEGCATDAWHDGITCEQYRQWRAENGQADESLERIIQEQGYKRCPGMSELRPGHRKDRRLQQYDMQSVWFKLQLS